MRFTDDARRQHISATDDGTMVTCSTAIALLTQSSRDKMGKIEHEVRTEFSQNISINIENNEHPLYHHSVK